MDDQKTLESIIKSKFPKLGKAKVVRSIGVQGVVLDLYSDNSVAWRLPNEPTGRPEAACEQGGE